MNRLPRYDKSTGWSELAAFLVLGLAGATLTGLSFFNGLKFAGEPDPRSTLVWTQRMEVVKQSGKTNLPLTNILFIQPPAPAGQAPPSRSLAAPQG